MLVKFCLLLTVKLAVANNLIPAADISSKDGGLLAQKCEKGMYFSKESAECEYCSECDQNGMYIRKECTQTKNTQCGWCASRQISDPAEFNEDGSIVVRSGKLTITMSNREDFDSLDKTDFSLAEEEDFMKNPVLDSNGIYIPELPDSKELTSEEIDDVIKAKEIDEADIDKFVEHKSVGTQTEGDDDEPPLADGDYDTYDQSEKNSIIDEEQADSESTASDDDDLQFHEREAYNWKNELKHRIEQDMIDKQTEEEEIENIKDIQEGAAIEVKPPQEFGVDSIETQELLRSAEEAEFVPLRIIVTGDVETLGNKKIPSLYDDDSSSEEDKSSDSSSSNEHQENLREYESLEAHEDGNTTKIRRMIHICIMSITFVIMCWIFLSYREKRRRRIFIIPPLDTFTLEQHHMINRCTCKINNLEAGHCYDNKLAYV